MGADRAVLDIKRAYSAFEFTRLCAGVIPREMEDKWFVFYEEPWLYVSQSWTSLCIYEVRFEQTPAGVRIAEAFVRAAPGQNPDYTSDIHILGRKLDFWAGPNSVK